jgi:hypothetical protein
MLNHGTCLLSRGNTQVQSRHERETAPGTQGLLGIMSHGNTPHSDQIDAIKPCPPVCVLYQRALGPHPHLEPGSSSADPAPVRKPSQSAPSAPLPARSRPSETAAATCPPQPVPHTKTRMRRRLGQRISPGRMMWIRFSARTIPHRPPATAISSATEKVIGNSSWRATQLLTYILMPARRA